MHWDGRGLGFQQQQKKIEKTMKRDKVADWQQESMVAF
jgi:hypothetical protein